MSPMVAAAPGRVNRRSGRTIVMGVKRDTAKSTGGSVSSPRHGQPGTDPIVVAAVPGRRVSGRSKRASYHAPRRRKLSCEQEAAIRVRSGNRSLRELGAEFGVSHETVRSVLRPPRSADVAGGVAAR